MGKLIIGPHMRLQEWVAEEKGYFKDEGLDYEFIQVDRMAKLSKKSAVDLPKEEISGAYQSFEQGRTCDVSSACHWTVNKAAAAGLGKLYAKAYSVTPSGIYVPKDSPVQKPEDLKDVKITVGYQSGSHYATIQALEPYMNGSDIDLHFGGMLFQRTELMLDGEIPAATLFGAPMYLAEQLGFRKIIDTTFMIAAMAQENASEEDLDKLYRALARAQADIDLRHDLYTHYFKKDFPERLQKIMDTRSFGPGERIVFLPYSKEIYDNTQNWVDERPIFDTDKGGHASYEDSTIQ